MDSIQTMTHKDFYNEPSFGMFGHNYNKIQKKIIGGIKRATSVIPFIPWFSEPVSIGVLVADINPKVFGPDGRLYQFLESYEEKHPGSVIILARQDTAKTLGNERNIEVIINEDIDEILQRMGEDQPFGVDKRGTIPFSLDLYEFVFADNRKHGFFAAQFLAVYDRKSDWTWGFPLYPRTIYARPLFDKTYELLKPDS